MTRAEELAAALERAVDELASVVEGLSDTEWRTLCPDEQRGVGVLTRHVAKGIPFEMVVFRQIAAGRQPATVPRAQLNMMNASDAEEWAECDRDETVALLRAYAAEAGDEIRGWSDEQLSLSGKYVEELPEAWTLDQWLERILVGHVSGHLRSIRAALEGGGQDTPRA